MPQRQMGIIGAGSVFTPELIDLVLQRELPLERVVLMDINARRLGILAEYARRQAKARHSSLQIVTTERYVDAIKGSDFILLQLRAGGNEMRIQDEQLALAHGIPFVETVSVPGLGAFLRTVPIYDEISGLVLHHAPTATVLNFTNPAGALTQYLQAKGIVRAVGVCNSPPGFLAVAGELLGTDPEHMAMNWRGLNHLTTVDQLLVDGEDRLQELLGVAPEWSHGFPFSRRVIGDLEMGLNGYWQYYLHAGRRLAELRGRTSSRGQDVLAIERDLLDLYARPDTIAVPELLKSRGGFGYSRVVVNLLESLLKASTRIHYVNVRNEHTLPSLPPETVVEVPTVADQDHKRVLPLAISDVPVAVRPLTLAMATVYGYWVEAALTQSLKPLRLSMLVHPLFPDAEDGEQLLAEFFERNAAYVAPYR